jgi:hypothetical protein
MPANAAIYIQQGSGDLTSVFSGVTSDKSLFRKPSWYDVPLGDDVIRFNVMPSSEVGPHVGDLLGYIASIEQDEDRKKDISFALGHTSVVLGLKTDREFEDNHAIWQSLFRVADAYNGFVFVYGSMLLPNGTVLVGPMLDDQSNV